MAKQVINTGSTPNDNTGTQARSAATIINENFTELYNAVATSSTANFVYATPNGSAGLPSLRALVSQDLPTTLSGKTISGATLNSMILNRTTFAGTSYAATTSHIFLEYIGTTSNSTLTLPTAVGNTGQMYYIRNSATGGGAIIVDPLGSETLNGLTTFLVYPNHAIQIISDGTNWKTLMRPVKQLMSTITFSSSASGEFVLPTTLLRGQFSGYELRLTNVQHSASGGLLYIRTSSNNGGSYNAGASDYAYALVSTAAAANTAGGATTSFIALSLGLSNTGTETGMTGTISISDPLQSTTRTSFQWNVSCRFTDNTIRLVSGGGERTAAEINNAFQIIPNTGNIVSGTASLYGVY